MALSQSDSGVLFDFGRDFDMAKIKANSVAVAIDKTAVGSYLDVRTLPGDYQWPGITLRIPLSSQDLSKYEYFNITIQNESNNPLFIAGSMTKEDREMGYCLDIGWRWLGRGTGKIRV